MKVKTILLTSIATLAVSSATVFAAAGSPVTHSHDGRSHSHPLPETGRNHTHGNKPTPKEKTPEKEGWFFVAESINGSIVRMKFHTDKVVSGKIQALFERDQKESATLFEYAVNVADCDAGYGALYRRELGTTGFDVSQSGWVDGGNSIASSIGETLCIALRVNHK